MSGTQARECKSHVGRSGRTVPARHRYPRARWRSCTTRPRSTSRRSSRSRKRASSRSGPGSSSGSGLSAPAVSETVNRLVDTATPSCSTTARSASPRRAGGLAPSIVRRHRLAERLLVDIIGLEWEKVHGRPTAGSTRSRPTSRRSSCCCSATRRPARTATRSRARGTRSTRRDAVTLVEGATRARSR